MRLGPRRAMDLQEIEWLRRAQHVTEGAIRFACETIARAKPRDDVGWLLCKNSNDRNNGRRLIKKFRMSDAERCKALRQVSAWCSGLPITIKIKIAHLQDALPNCRFISSLSDFEEIDLDW